MLNTDFHNAMVDEARAKIDFFADLHPHVDNRGIRTSCVLWRDGDWMGCTHHEEHILAPYPGKRIETNPMVLSLSRFD